MSGPVPYVWPGAPFPEVSQSLPSGLLAWGADLSVPTLLRAYTHAIFPWFDTLPILWWSPDPRTIIRPAAFREPSSLSRVVKQRCFHVTMNHCFETVIRVCADMPRPGQEGTWITEEMIQAYLQLHEAGWAHSVETWSDRLLVGGLYGVGIGAFFAGESMFSLATEASRMALRHMVEQMRQCDQSVIDCQFLVPHLARVGAEEVSRTVYQALLQQALSGCLPFTRDYADSMI